MKYYSELTKRPYDTVEELKAAEKKILDSKKKEDAKKAERTAAAKELEEAIKRASDAQKEALAKLNNFCEKYGSFHTTYHGLSDLADSFIDFLLW